jgi:hypothetical protein
MEVFCMTSVNPVYQLPSWCPSLELQVEWIRRFLADRGIANLSLSPDLMDQISNFVPRTASEVPLIGAYLHGDDSVENTFKEMWRLIKAPNDRDGKLLWNDLETGPKYIRLLPGTEHRHRPGIRLIALDVNVNQRMPVATCWENSARLLASAKIAPDFANIEILMLAALAPDWVSSWNGSAENPYPNMPGYQFYLGPEGWAGSLGLGRWWVMNSGLRPLGLRALWAGLAWDGWSSPTIREV